MMKKIAIIPVILILSLGLMVSGCTEPAIELAIPAPAITTSAKPIVLTFASHAPGTRVVYQFLEKEWGPRLEELTNGQIKFEYYWGGVLGKGPDAYKMITTGICDIALVVPVYYSGTFPLSEASTIPGFWPANKPEKCNCIARAIWDEYLIPLEWSDVKVLFIHVGSPGSSIQTTKKPIKTLDDFKGLQLGCSGVSQIQCLEAVGATPIQVTAPEAYVALERGIIEGYLFPTSGFAEWGYMETTKYHIPFDVGYVSSAFPMNLKTWHRLPADVQKVFEDTREWTNDTIMGLEITATEEAMNTYRDIGIEINYLSPEDEAKYHGLVKPYADKWKAEMDAKGLPGTEMWAEAQRLSATEGECNE